MLGSANPAGKPSSLFIDGGIDGRRLGWAVTQRVFHFAVGANFDLYAAALQHLSLIYAEIECQHPDAAVGNYAA